MKRMSGLLMLLAVAGIVVGCANLDRVRPYYDEAKTVIGFVMDKVDDKDDPPAETPSAVVTNVPAPAPVPANKIVIPPGHENWYGRVIRPSNSHGSYKPWGYPGEGHIENSKMYWLLARVQPTDIWTAGLYKLDGTFVRWCNWPNGIGPLSGLPIDGRQITQDPTHPWGWRSSAPPKGSGVDHSGRVKIRNAKPSDKEWAEGARVLKVIDGFGQVVHIMYIEDRNIRHEGRLK